MKNLLYASFGNFYKVVCLCFVFLCFCNVNKVSAQVINEGFEESVWQAIANSSNGVVNITATGANSTMIYYYNATSSSSTYTAATTNTSTFASSSATTGTGSTKASYTVYYTSSGLNTSPNSGAWSYSKMTTNSDTKLNKAHSATTSAQLTTSGYLITPVINNGLASLTLWMAPQGAFAVGINTNTSATQPTYTSSGTNTLGGFTYYTQSFPASGTAGYSSMQSFNIPVTFSGPCQVGIFNASSSSIYLDDIVITSFATGTLPTVTLNSATKNGQFGGNAAATISTNNPTPYSTVFQSGIIWSTTNTPLPDTSLSTKTTNGPGGFNVFSGPIAAAITGLTAGTNYYVRAYAVTSGGLVYSNMLSFITDPPVIPTLSTVNATGVTSLSAISGGTFGNDGGATITAKGVCWSTATNPTIALPTKTNDGTGATNFTSTLAVLAPSTTYYTRAYATNSVGTAYGNQITFTTPAASPTLLALPNSLNFGNVVINTTSAENTFSLTGIVLTPTNGSITLTAPTNYQISLTSGAGYTSSLNVPYASGTLATTTVYVHFTPTLYGPLPGNITITGGGVPPQNVALTGIGIQSPNDYSNKGTDFWVGYASHQDMYNGATTIESNGGDQTMVLYFTSDQNATVTVSIPGLGYNPAPVAVVANAVTTFTIPNQIAAQYPELYLEGKSVNGIHITSDIPIVGYAHIYADYVSGATLLLPTTTWGTEYNSINYTQNAGSNDDSYSYFFVVAKDDNTTLQITPTNTTLGGKLAGVPFAVTLNKGEIYNVLGGTGTDFTGSKIKSTDCNKKIAVFSGNNRTQIAPCSGTSSDNLFQQATPKGAWGTKYLTSQTIGTVRNNIFRVCVSDPASVVKVNGVPLPSTTYPTATLQNNFFYEFEDSIPTSITADKPIMVAQYCKSTNGCTSSTGGPVNGDPEMIFISPVEQAINKAILYCSPNQTIAFHFINVIIPNAGVAGFTLDGVNMSSKFKPHFEPGFSYAALDSLNGAKLQPGKHIIQSTVGFNAIVYGFGDNTTGGSKPPRESYGYNAGTQLKDLTQNLLVQNPYAISSSATTCKNMPFKFRIVLPYSPANVFSLTWNFNNNINLSPTNTNITQTVPASDSMFTLNGQSLYVYSIPTLYTFTASGTYPVSVTANVNSLDGCSGSKSYNFNVIVTDGVIANFTMANYRVCFKDSARFFDASNGQGSTIIKWNWDFGNGTIDSVKNPVRYYTSPGVYTVKLRSINDVGCYADYSRLDTVLVLPAANFTSNAPVCINVPIQFTDASTPGGGTINTWLWNFGDLTPTSSTQNPTHTYATANTFNVKLNLITADGCKDSTTKSVTVLPILSSPTVTVGTITPTSVQFNWAAVANASGYEVSINGGTYQSVGTNLTYTASNLQPNQAVTIIVRALGTLVCQQNTGTASATTLLPDLGIFVPNTFTPNGDGKNDVFKVYGNLIQKVHIQIFNQWGQKIFETTDVAGGWDGTYNGQAQPVGVYIYVVSAVMTDGRTINKKGSINLIR